MFCFGPERAVGADHRMDAALGAVAHHGAQVFVHQRLAADEEQVADVVASGDVDDVAGFLQGDAWRRFAVEAVYGKPAEVAFRVADIGDGKLEIARPAMVEHLTDELEGAFLLPGHGFGGIDPHFGGHALFAGIISVTVCMNG